MKRDSRAPLIVAIVLLLLASYVGSYAALVNPNGQMVLPSGAWCLDVSHYRVYANGWTEKVFWPLEQIDRKLRPGAWNPWKRLRHQLHRLQPAPESVP